MFKANQKNKIKMLEKHQEAPDSFETPTTVSASNVNWERLRDAPLVGIDGTIDWNQIDRERMIGIEPEYHWTEEDDGGNNNDDNGSESLDENEVNDDYEDEYEYFLEEQFEAIEWMPNEFRNDELNEMMVVD